MNAFLLLLLTALAQAAPKSEKNFGAHVVRPTETLWSIAIHRYKAPFRWLEIAKWNNLAAPYTVFPEQRLILRKKPLRADPPLAVADEETRSETGAKYADSVRETTNALAAAPTSAKKLCAQGRSQLEEDRPEAALELFRQGRAADPRYLPCWLFEIRTLRSLKREAEARETTALFLKHHPKVKALAPRPQ
jgi:hypothetical protein